MWYSNKRHRLQSIHNLPPYHIYTDLTPPTQGRQVRAPARPVQSPLVLPGLNAISRLCNSPFLFWACKLRRTNIQVGLSRIQDFLELEPPAFLREEEVPALVTRECGTATKGIDCNRYTICHCTTFIQISPHLSVFRSRREGSRLSEGDTKRFGDRSRW